jgi:hypothetical protein
MQGLVELAIARSVKPNPHNLVARTSQMSWTTLPTRSEATF